MRLRNSTDIPNEVVYAIIRFTKPSGISNFTVDLRDQHHWHIGGGAYWWQNMVLLRLGLQEPVYTHKRNGIVVRQVWMYPRKHSTYQYGQLKGRRYYIADRLECLVYLSAHELRHIWQAKRIKRGRTWGSRGRFSEIDAESYAINKLRAWRKDAM